MANEPTRGRGQSPHAPPSLVEWIAAGLGGVAVVTALAFLSCEAATTGPHPAPRLAVRVDTTIRYQAGYLVEFRLVNGGDATAARVVVQGELRAGGGVVERAQSTIDFVPAQSFRTGGLIFTNDPRRYQVDVRAVGFDRP